MSAAENFPPRNLQVWVASLSASPQLGEKSRPFYIDASIKLERKEGLATHAKWGAAVGCTVQ